MRKIVVVDNEDNIIDYQTREEVDRKNLRYRVSAIWIENSKGEILFEKRAHTKVHDPGKWSPVAGTVEKGESYEGNAIKELREELGMTNVKLRTIEKLKSDEKYKYFVQWFLAIIDEPIEKIKIQNSEVEEVKWFSKNELEKQFKNNPENFVPAIKEMLKQSH